MSWRRGANLEALQFGSPTILAANQYESCWFCRAKRGYRTSVARRRREHEKIESANSYCAGREFIGVGKQRQDPFSSDGSHSTWQQTYRRVLSDQLGIAQPGGHSNL